MAWVLYFVYIDAQQAWPMQTPVWKALLSQRRLLIQTISRKKKKKKKSGQNNPNTFAGYICLKDIEH